MKFYKVDLKGTTQYAFTVIAVDDEKDLENKLLHIAEEHDESLDWQLTKGITVQSFEEVTDFEDVEGNCINEEIETKEDWDNVTLKKFVKGEAVNTQKGGA